VKALILKAISNLRYESTLSGLTLLVGLVGAKLAPEQLPAIATAVVAIVGLLKTFLSDADVA
jgi:hypothetical protein